MSDKMQYFASQDNGDAEPYGIARINGGIAEIYVPSEDIWEPSAVTMASIFSGDGVREIGKADAMALKAKFYSEQAK